MFEQYRPSGKIGPLGIPAMLITGVSLGLILGIIYTFLLVWIPFIYINFLATGALGVGLGMGVDMAARFGRVRNAAAAHFFGFVAGMAGLYAAWAWDGVARSGADDSIPALWNPIHLIGYMQVFYETGFWGFKDTAISGLPLAAIWVLEALLVLGASTLLAGSTASTPFCESCNAWTEEAQAFKRLMPPDDPEPLTQLSDGDLSALNQFTACQDVPDQSVRLDLFACPECAETRFLTVNLSRITVDKDGDSSEQVTTIIERMVLNAESMQQLQTTLDGLDVVESPANGNELADSESETADTEDVDSEDVDSEEADAEDS